jgi:hypothetical protein
LGKLRQARGEIDHADFHYKTIIGKDGQHFKSLT